MFIKSYDKGNWFISSTVTLNAMTHKASPASICGVLLCAYKETPNWAICPCTLHIRQQNVWSSITASLELGENQGLGTILLQHIVGIPSHRDTDSSLYVFADMFKIQITSSIHYSEYVTCLEPKSVLSILASHLWYLWPLTFSRGQLRSYDLGWAIVSVSRQHMSHSQKTHMHAHRKDPTLWESSSG